jgi:uncharacterized membrane protein
MEENSHFARLAGMRRRVLFGAIFAAMLVLALLGACAQALRGRRPLLLAGA